MANKNIKLKVIDPKGRELTNSQMTIPKNGFIDLWLPRKETFDIIITKDDKVSTKTITTNKGDNTCITDVKLK